MAIGRNDEGQWLAQRLGEAAKSQIDRVIARRGFPGCPHGAGNKSVGDADPHDTRPRVRNTQCELTAVIGGRKAVDVEGDDGARNAPFASRRDSVSVGVVENEAGNGNGASEQALNLPRLLVTTYPFNRFSGSTPVSTTSPLGVIRTSATGVASSSASV